jgi:hypothetical protein
MLAGLAAACSNLGQELHPDGSGQGGDSGAAGSAPVTDGGGRDAQAKDDGNGSAGASGAGGARDGGTDATVLTGAAATLCTRWKTDRASVSEGTWSGAVATCKPGDLSADARTNALRLVNLYRFLVAMPTVVNDTSHDSDDQSCALMMRANNMLSHDPPTDWLCYSAAGAKAAGNSNISTAPAVASVDLYMYDNGNATTLGHRRWMLSNSLGPIGIGGTDRASCMWTLNGSGNAGKSWVAWPAPGIIPLEAITPAHGTGLDVTGWSIQTDAINLANAAVTVTSGGTSMPVNVTQLLAGYGSRYAIRFNPLGWTTQAGKTYSVTISGISPTISYDVQVVDCH